MPLTVGIAGAATAMPGPSASIHGLLALLERELPLVHVHRVRLDFHSTFRFVYVHFKTVIWFTFFCDFLVSVYLKVQGRLMR